jgi:competence protein ComEC
VWDVGHGSSISIKAPNGKTAMLDLGANTETEFSPIEFTKTIWNLERLDFLTISHPHVDHIRDILNLGLLDLQVFTGRTVPSEQLFKEQIAENDRELLKAYSELSGRFVGPVSSDQDPRIGSWGDIAYFRHYLVEDADWETEPNNTSIVTFYRIGTFTMLYPGDMESRGWSELLKKKDFVSDLKTTCFLVASHHGREKGFSKEILDIAEPLLTIVSDSWFKDTSVTAWYSDLSYGFEVKNDNTGKKEQRKVISTRADGRIIIDVSDDGANTTADVRVKKTPVL